MDTRLVKPDGLIKPGVPARSESFQKAAIPQSNVMPPEQPSGKAAVGRGEQNVQAGKLFMEAAANLGLPKDALSVALLVFTRFFSLSADKALIGNLRREILDQLKTSSPGTAEEKAALEAKVMAAVVAADKGVFLSPAALERYARFLMPAAFVQSAFMPQSSEEKEAPSPKTTAANRDSREKTMGKTHGKTHGETRSKIRSATGEELPEADELKAIAEAQTREDGLLDFFNRLPGENGQNWLVLPFNINVKGIELKVLLRVLRSERASVPGIPSASEDGQMIADISGPKRQWRCFVKQTGGKLRLDIRVYPEQSQRALNHLRKQAERFLGKGGGLMSAIMPSEQVPSAKKIVNFGDVEEISVRNSDRIPLWTEDLRLEYLPFLDEEV
jgi:hypothetical protein